MARGVSARDQGIRDRKVSACRPAISGIVFLGISAWLLVCPMAISAFIVVTPSHIASTACCILGDLSPITSRVINIKGNGEDIPRVVRYSPSGEWLAVGTMTAVILYDASTLSQVWTIPSAEVSALTFSPGGMTLAVFCHAGWLKLVSTVDGQLLSIKERFDSVSFGFGLAFSPDGSLIAAGSDEGSVRVWSLSDPRPLLTMNVRDATPTQSWITHLIFSKDGTMLIAAEAERMNADEPIKNPSVHVWRVADGSLVNTQTVSNYGFPLGLADGGDILIAVTAGALQRWRVETTGLSLIMDAGKSKRGYSSGSLSADESVFVVGTHPGNFVTIWRFGDRKVEIMPGHTKEIASVAVSPDGHTIASASFDGTIRLSIVDFDDCSLLAWVHPIRC